MRFGFTVLGLVFFGTAAFLADYAFSQAPQQSVSVGSESVSVIPDPPKFDKSAMEKVFSRSEKCGDITFVVSGYKKDDVLVILLNDTFIIFLVKNDVGIWAFPDANGIFQKFYSQDSFLKDFPRPCDYLMRVK